MSRSSSRMAAVRVIDSVYLGEMKPSRVDPLSPHTLETRSRAMPKSSLDRALTLRALGSEGEEFKRALEQVSRSAHLYARKGPHRLNPDLATVHNVLEGLARNKVKYGRAYCPCRPVRAVPALDSQNICPCRSHPSDIARDGACGCGLFVSQAYAERKRKNQGSTKT